MNISLGFAGSIPSLVGLNEALTGTVAVRSWRRGRRG